MKKIKIIILLLTVFQIASFSQYSVKVGTQSGNWEALPCSNEYQYSWTETLYQQSEIQSHGTITDIYYKSHFDGVPGPGSNEYLFNQRIFMKLVTDAELNNTTFPDTNQMTLVYAAPENFLNYQLATIHLDTPFNYTPGYNLLILYVNKNSYIDNFSEFIHFPCDHSSTTNRTVYRYMNSSFQGGNGTFSSSAPVIYLKYAPGLDVGISAINDNKIYKLPQQTDLTCKFHNYMADTITDVNIEWKLNGSPQSNYNWTGTNFCGQASSPIILQNNFAFAPGNYNIKANTTNPNSGTDELNTNDTLNINIKVSDYRQLTSTSYQDNAIPFLSNRPYGWSVSIYNKDSIEISGPINVIAYYVNNTNGMAEPHQKIFMRTTTDLTNSSLNYPDTNLFIKVFDGTIDYSTQGWHIIKLDTVFDYNNAENLMILYENHAGIGTIQATDFKTVWLHTNAICNYDMNSFPTNAGQTASNSRVPAIQLYFSIPKDAGVIKLANSDVPVFTGNNNFIIDFKNFGSDTLQDVDIKYQIDQNTPTLYHWNGIANPQNEISNLNIGSSNLSYGNHAIAIWTENPDYLPDYVNRNDTLKISLRACSPLSGTYTIGTAPSDFLSIKAAVDSLNNCGINGAVTFNIKTGTYNSQYVLNEVLGSSSTNTITFQSATGDSTDVVLTTDSTNYLFYLNGADNINFKHLTFSSDSASQFIVMDSVATNNIFTGNIFTSDTTDVTFVYSTSDFDNSNSVFQGNLFKNGYDAIHLDSDNVSETGTLITQNIFSNQTNKNVCIHNSDSINIGFNTFFVKNTGIDLNNCKKIKVNANNIRLTSAKIGIGINRCPSNITTPTISNNFISGDIIGNYGNSGIFIEGDYSATNYADIYYNSINISGSSAESAIFMQDVDSVKIFNNIIIHKTGNVIKEFSTNFNSNYNCFYTTNIYFANFGGTNITDLQDWQTTTGMDTNSIFVLPSFVNDSDLHTNSLFIDNIGTPLADVTYDIDGETRNALTPDIGADEFTSSCTGPLAGTYTIGTTGDYQSFNDAINALYCCGVADTVVFNVETGNYNEQVNINGGSITYDSIPYPITFQSETGDSSDVILWFDADSLNNYVLKLSEARNMYFKNMTFKSLDTNYARLAVFEDSVENMVFSNNQFIGAQSISDDNQIACIYADNLNETDTMAFTFNNNYIVNGSFGIDFDFGWSSQVKTNFMLSYNKFYNQSYAGINLNGVSNIQIIKNNIIQSTNNPAYGVFIVSDSINIFNNKIILSSNRECYGIEDYSSHNIIANNFISLKGTQNSNVIGYYSNNFSRILYNTILCYGEGYYFSSCIHINSSTSAIATNNNLVNLITEKVIYYEDSPIISDYNNLYSNSSYFNFIDWQTSTGMDAHSVSFLPNFVSNTDLHTHDALLNGKGTPLTQVTNDIDGEPRNTSTPDIGADEFDNPVFNAGNDTIFCYYSDQYNNISTYVYEIGSGYDTYQWSNGSDSSSIVIDTSNTPVGNSTYTVTVTIGTNTYSDTVNIIYDKPNPITQLDYCCWNSPITITANPGFESYSWSTGDTTQLISYNNYYGGTTLNILVQDSLGCYAKKSLAIVGAYSYYYPYSNYPANFNLSDTSICNNQSLLLAANQYSDTAIYNNFSFEWNTGDTTQSLTIDSNSFVPGNYMLTTTVYLEANQRCSSSDTINVIITDCSGIPEIDNFDVTVYPNPAHSKIIVDGEKIKNYQILSVTGIMLRQQRIKTMPATIDVSTLSKGIYFLKLQFDNHLSIKKIIIN